MDGKDVRLHLYREDRARLDAALKPGENRSEGARRILREYEAMKEAARTAGGATSPQ